ncbi:hypothetical protein [Nocardia sp. NPDC004260]
MPNHHPAIIALYRATEDPEDLTRADAYRGRVRDAALRLVTETRAELLALPAGEAGYRIRLRGCIGTEVRRALEHGATSEQVRAALTAPTGSPELPPVSTEIVRLTLPQGGYAEWADHGPDRPALVSLYTRHGQFAGLERTSYATDETTAQAIARLTAARPDAQLSRDTRHEDTPSEPAPRPAATGPQTATEEGQSRC